MFILSKVVPVEYQILVKLYDERVQKENKSLEVN